MALTLTRRYGERLIVGDDIRIIIRRGCRPNNVRLTIEAPKHVRVVREELLSLSERRAVEEAAK
jgi:carbon storage regulator CsrA